MKDEVISMYREGFTIREIAEETGLYPSTVGQYVYASRVNKGPQAREAQLLMKIRKLISGYEEEFGTFHL